MLGFINIYKPEGMSSAYAVGKLKKAVKIPCGHMGTLDPMASGVLPVGIGKTSRLFPYLLDKEKEYYARFKFGYSTDTLDVTGRLTATTDNIPKKCDIEKAIKNFIGQIEQVPPLYSAKCVDGKRGYQLARRGVDFTLPAKKVTVLDIKCTGEENENEYGFIITCKGGTYIRSLCRDIASSLQSLATMSSLERTRAGVFTVENSIKVQDISEENIQKYLISSDSVVDFTKLEIGAERFTKILNGVFNDYGYKDGIYRVYKEGEFVGIGEAKDGVLRIKSYVR